MPPLQARFDGTATLQLSHPLWADPMTVPLSVDLTFSADLWTVTIGQLPEFRKTVDTPVGPNTTILRITNAFGNYFPEAAVRHPNWPEGSRIDTGVPARRIELYFGGWLDHSIDLGAIADVNSPLGFSGGRAGPPPASSIWALIDADGNLSLWDEGRFQVGILSLKPREETKYTFLIKGRIQPAPGITSQPRPAALNLSMTPRPILHTTIDLMVHAADDVTGNTVAGTVEITNLNAKGSPIIQQFPTDIPTSITFRTRRVRNPDGNWETISPQGFVSAPGYPDTPLPFGWG
jgi:hypothetical protein